MSLKPKRGVGTSTRGSREPFRGSLLENDNTEGSWMSHGETIIAIDVGSGTQDIFFLDPAMEVENCLQMVLPSPTSLLARKISQARERRIPIHLTGNLMGGGPVAWAVREHLRSGLAVTAEPEAALTLHDDLSKVEEMGVRLNQGPLPGAMVIRMGDVEVDFLEGILRRVGLESPDIWCVAVQDHGHQPKGSNRAFRFQHWEGFLEQGGKIEDALYSEPPHYLTRMSSVLKQVPNGRVMDTGMAAINGALCDPWVASKVEEGVMVVNLGNQHTLAALISGERAFGLFEHHTGALSAPSLVKWLERFRKGDLSSQEVREDGGHGCAYSPESPSTWNFPWTVVTGPRRQMARGLGWYMAAPFGNMMLTGCFGLVRAYMKSKGIHWPQGGEP